MVPVLRAFAITLCLHILFLVFLAKILAPAPGRWCQRTIGALEIRAIFGTGFNRSGLPSSSNFGFHL
ncbi:MAG: hypothetical protein EOP62_02295 [Sphingomonadales bacterium]|nr:MAG: hypothetical protein EOP62_02295 [Sphingomonadales bacterium]